LFSTELKINGDITVDTDMEIFKILLNNTSNIGLQELFDLYSN